MKRVLGIIWLLAIVACKQAPPEGSKLSAEADLDAKPNIKLYAFDGGSIQVNNLGLFAQGDTYKGQHKTFANGFYVIQHPKGNLMWDAGLPESLVAMEEPYTSPDGAFTVSRKDSLKNQLEEIGLTIDDFKYLCLSHTHFDHVGHAAALKKATWLVQEEEYNWVTGKEVRESTPQSYEAIKDLKKIEMIRGDHDVFGDGSVILKYMPGHTPGHQVLFVDLKKTGPVMLSGDLYHFSENRAFKRIPIFNYDVKQTLESMERFEEFAEKYEAKVFLQHEPNDFNAMPKVPEYLN